jgi:RND family efflux transporter MFP subunit
MTNPRELIRPRCCSPIRCGGLFILALLIAGLGTACDRKAKREPLDRSALPALKVQLRPAEKKSHTHFEEITGTLRSKVRATLEAKVSGRIVDLPVVLGQAVKAGDLMARLDAAEIVARLEQANAAVEQAEREWKRASALFKEQAVTRAEYDAAESRLRVARGGAAEAKAMLGYVEVRAPFAGVVTRKWVDVGDLASPGKPLVGIEDPSVLQLEADIPEAIASHIHPQARLAVRVEGRADLNAEVVEIAPVSDPESRTFRIKLNLPSGAGLMPGRFARLLVPVGEGVSIRVPASALVRRGQLEILFVSMSDRAQLRLVKSGKRWGDAVEILSGLEDRELVVTEGAAQLSDGQPLEAR